MIGYCESLSIGYWPHIIYAAGLLATGIICGIVLGVFFVMTTMEYVVTIERPCGEVDDGGGEDECDRQLNSSTASTSQESTLH